MITLPAPSSAVKSFSYASHGRLHCYLNVCVNVVTNELYYEVIHITLYENIWKFSMFEDAIKKYNELTS